MKNVKMSELFAALQKLKLWVCNVTQSRLKNFILHL